MHLPIVQPIFNYSPPYNYLTSLIRLSDNYRCNYLENYIQIQYKTSDYCWPDCVGFCNWSLYDFIEVNYLNRDISLYSSDISELLCSFLDQGYYVAVNINMYFVAPYHAYHNTHFRHDIFIYGYEKEKRTFYCADFFDSEVYSYQTCTFEDVRDGISKFWGYIIQTGISRAYDNLNGIVLLRPKDNYIREVNVEKIYRALCDLTNEEYKGRSDWRLGLGWFQDFAAAIKSNEFKDVQSNEFNYVLYKKIKMGLHFLSEHIKAMAYREEYLLETKNHGYESILNSTLYFRNKLLKGYMKNQQVNDALISEISEVLLKTHESYKWLILSFIRKLKG